MSKCCPDETFPHFSPQTLHLSICYYHRRLLNAVIASKFFAASTRRLALASSTSLLRQLCLPFPFDPYSPNHNHFPKQLHPLPHSSSFISFTLSLLHFLLLSRQPNDLLNFHQSLFSLPQPPASIPITETAPQSLPEQLSSFNVSKYLFNTV